MDNEFVLMLDDYKIHIQHELINLNNKIESMKSIKFINPIESSPKEINKFKNEFYEKLNLISKRVIKIEDQIEIIKKNNISFSKKLDNDIYMCSSYTNIRCFITAVVCTCITIVINVSI